MIIIKELTKKYFNKNSLEFKLDSINLTINKNDVFGIVGKSGSGKTTLLNLIGLLDDYDNGEIVINNTITNTLLEKEKRLFRKSIGYIFQELNLLSNLNIIDNISLPLKLNGINKSDRYLKATEIMDYLGLNNLEQRYPHQLSGGQLQRVAIARALITNPKILLCDEITSSLDFETSLEIVTLLDKVKKEFDLTIIFVSHNLDIVKTICSKVAIIKEGILEDVISLNKINLTNNTLDYKNYLLGENL